MMDAQVFLETMPGAMNRALTGLSLSKSVVRGYVPAVQAFVLKVHIMARILTEREDEKRFEETFRTGRFKGRFRGVAGNGVSSNRSQGMRKVKCEWIELPADRNGQHNASPGEKGLQLPVVQAACPRLGDQRRLSRTGHPLRSQHRGGRR